MIQLVAGVERRAEKITTYRRMRLIPPACVVSLTAAYAVAMWRALPPGQIDLGGDYAYAAWQMSHGAVLYRDVLGQQTPLLYLLGAMGYRLWPQPATFLGLALAVHAATVIAVFALARALRFPPVTSVVASVIYLTLPMGFYFDARLDPNILITLGGVLCALALARVTSGRAFLAGFGCAVFILAKLTFVPIGVALAAYIVLARRAALAAYVGALLITLLCATLAGWVIAGSDFLDGAFLAHAGSTLSLDNLMTSVRYIWNVEGLTIILAVIGALTGWRGSGAERLLGLYLLGGLATLGATISVGSLAPEMLAAEPAIALCAALALHRAATVLARHAKVSRDARLALPVLALFVVGQCLALRNDAATYANVRGSTGLACMVALLRDQSNSRPVIAPPYAALLAHRTLEEGLSDVFNWSIRVHRGDDVALRQAALVDARLARHALALVAFDADHPLPPMVVQTVERFYRYRQSCAATRIYLPPN